MDKIDLLLILLIFASIIAIPSAKIANPTSTTISTSMSTSMTTTASSTTTSTSSTSSTSSSTSSTTTTTSTTSVSVTTIFATLNFPVSYTFVTNYNNAPQCSFASSTSPQTSTPPINSVVSNNNQNAIWLLTAPNPPYYNPVDDYDIISNPSTYIAGDECLVGTSPLYTTISYDVGVSYSNWQLASASLENWQVSNPATLSISNLGFSPMVDGEISSNYQTSTYIFNQIPPAVQQDVWTWGAKFADFNNANVPPESNILSNLPYQTQSTISYNGNTYGVTCYYTYDYSENTVVNSISNYVIPMNVIGGTDSNGDYYYTTFNTPILPYILYNFSMPSIGGSYMNLSYDTFGPWTYNAPASSLEPFPVSTPSKFYVSYKSTLTQSSIYDIDEIGMAQGSGNNNGMPNIFPVKSPAVADPISITASPNDYVYVLNYSPSNGNYYLTVLRLIPHGYYNVTNSPPTSVGPASSNDEWFSEWNNYWQNVIAMQNNETYVIKSIDLSTVPEFQGEYGQIQFTPLNISADANGDVFISGWGYGNTWNNAYGLIQPYLAEISNVLGSPSYTINEIYVPGDSLNPANFILPEIAVSPTGLQVYMANQSDGHIFVYSGENQSLLQVIDLAYNEETGGITTAALNISAYLANGGLYNDSLPWAVSNAPDVLDHFYYHHPVAIYDVNGYLYVLDNWAGAISVTYSCGWEGLGGCTDIGTYFDFLVLRVINSTGINIPINPTNFNDMYQLSKCEVNGGTGSLSTSCQAAGTSPPGICESSSGSPNNCEWTSSSCVYQVEDRHITYGTEYSCVSKSNKKSSTYISLAPPYVNNEYPPYGWILSANVTRAKLKSLPYFGFSTNVYAFTPDQGGEIYSSNAFNSNSPPPSNYYGAYQPIGPPLYAWSTASVEAPLGGFVNRAMQNTTYSNIHYTFTPHVYWSGMTVNFNDSVDMLFPQLPSARNSPACPWEWTCDQYNSNQYAEMILTRMNIENYTKLFGGNSPYTCLVYSSASPQNNPSQMCQLSSNLQYMTPPLYTVTSPFGYLESLGTVPIYTLISMLYSSALAAGSGGKIYNSCNAILGAQSFNSVSGSVGGENCLAGNTPEIIANAITSNVPSLNGITYSTLIGVPQEFIKSLFSSEVLIPYNYTYTISQNWYYWNYQGYSISPQTDNSAVQQEAGSLCSSNIPAPPSSSSSTNVYTYAVLNSVSNELNTTIEGGYVYAQYPNNGSYYIPNLSDMGVILPPQLIFNLKASRTIGNMYVNLTMSNNGGTNGQAILNATHQLNYYVITNEMQSVITCANTPQSICNLPPCSSFPSFEEGLCLFVGYDVENGQCSNSNNGATYSEYLCPYVLPVFQTINSITLTSPEYGEEAYEAIAPSGNPSNFCKPPASTNSIPFNYTFDIWPNAVSLFTWYKLLPYQNPTAIYLNGTQCAAANIPSKTISGYSRLIYVYQDKFNNTIYMPLDADIANITRVDLNISSIPNPGNANQTQLNINGTAGYYFGSKFIPLSNSPIYLYYDADINYIGYNALLSPYSNNAILCAFGASNSFVPQGCGSLSNPIYTGLTQNANVITYYPMFNSSGSCPPPPNSLLAQPTQFCNIYGSNVIVNGQSVSPVTCGINSNTLAQEFCIPDSSLPNEPSGTGICSSQIGLVGIATTNSMGAFSFTTNACGLGTAEIIASFYGAPAPEPTTASQVPLSYSADPTYAENFPTFSVVNYSWAPNQTAERVQLGFYQLGYGNISIDSIIIAAVLALLIAMLLKKKE